MSYTRKNKLLLSFTLAGGVLCWFFAFNQTFQAIKLHSELESQSAQTPDLSFNPAHSSRKLIALQDILNAYRVNETTWNNELWLKVSAMAMKQKVGITYTKAEPGIEKDTTTLGKTETLFCYGRYLQLVKLIDTLERTRSIGKISALQIKAPKPETTGELTGKCVLRLDIKGLTWIYR